MYVRMGLTNGQIVESDSYPEESLLEILKEKEWRPGTGDFENVYCETLDDFYAFYDRVMHFALNDMENGKVGIEIDGRHVEWPSREVGWMRTVHD